MSRPRVLHLLIKMVIRWCLMWEGLVLLYQNFLFKKIAAKCILVVVVKWHHHENVLFSGVSLWNCTFVIRFQECSWARQDVRYSDTSPCSVQTCFSSSDRGWLTCLIFHELLRQTFWWQTGDDTSCTYTRLMNMNFSRKKSILIGCLQFYNRPISQSCAVAEGEQFWQATGQSNLAYKRLAATKAVKV